MPNNLLSFKDGDFGGMGMDGGMPGMGGMGGN